MLCLACIYLTAPSLLQKVTVIFSFSAYLSCQQRTSSQITHCNYLIFILRFDFFKGFKSWGLFWGSWPLFSSFYWLSAQINLTVAHLGAAPLPPSPHTGRSQLLWLRALVSLSYYIQSRRPKPFFF